MVKIFKTKIYRVTYSDSGGADHFDGRYILNNEWILNRVKSGSAQIERVS